MRLCLKLLALCCACLLLAGTSSTVMAQDSNVRVTWSNSWGFGETLAISQTAEGATILREFVLRMLWFYEQDPMFAFHSFYHSFCKVKCSLNVPWPSL